MFQGVDSTIIDVIQRKNYTQSAFALLLDSQGTKAGTTWDGPSTPEWHQVIDDALLNGGRPD